MRKSLQLLLYGALQLQVAPKNLVQMTCVWNKEEYGYSHVSLHSELMSLPETGPINPDMPSAGQAGSASVQLSPARRHHVGQTCSEQCKDTFPKFLNYLNA